MGYDLDEFGLGLRVVGEADGGGEDREEDDAVEGIVGGDDRAEVAQLVVLLEAAARVRVRARLRHPGGLAGLAIGGDLLHILHLLRQPLIFRRVFLLLGVAVLRQRFEPEVQVVHLGLLLDVQPLQLDEHVHAVIIVGMVARAA